MTRTPTPIESFGPEIMQALLAGAKGRYEIELDYARAVKFRQRVYQLRNSMRHAAHEAYITVSRTRIQIVWGTAIGDPEVPENISRKKTKWPKDIHTRCKLIISPYDSEFADALGKVGIKAGELSSDPLNTQSSALDKYLPKEQ